MQINVDRPTAVANALAAAVTDTFDEGHPGADILKHENTARNRIKREIKRDNMRNIGGTCRCHPRAPRRAGRAGA